MDENQSSPSAPNVDELQTQCQWLRKQIQIILVLLIMVSGILTLFLHRQNKYAGIDLNGVKPIIEEYTKNQAPMMDDFVKRLADYGKTHPDFAAITKKYGLDQLPPAPTNPPKK